MSTYDQCIELYWLRMLFKKHEVPLLSPPCIGCDNFGALAIASNPIFHVTTKHIKVGYHFIREKILLHLYSNVQIFLHKGCPLSDFFSFEINS